MQVEDLEHFKDLLSTRNHRLSDWLNSMADADMAEAEKVRALVGQIKAALERIELRSYGKCVVCDGEIEHFHLEVQPEATICLGCLNEEEQALLEDDLRMAGRMQRALLPAQLPQIQGFSAAARWVAATVVGGDYYDFLPCGKPDQLSRVIIADAMGHGVSASLLMSNLQGALRVLSLELHSPAELVGKLNQWLCRNVATTKFISLVNLCLERTDADETMLTYANAGHCPPILARSDGSIERLEVTGGILGVHEEFAYGEGCMRLWSGDLIVLYTDGVTEATNSEGERFCEDRLLDFIDKHRRGGVESILDNLQQEIARFSGNANRNDDLTLIALQKL